MSAIQIVFSKSEAEALQHANSDFLCWIEGFIAAGGSFSGDRESIRKFNIRLKGAIDEEEGK